MTEWCVKQVICSVIDQDKSFEVSASVKERVVDCLSTFVQSVNHLFELFSSEPSANTMSYETLISDSTFTIESLKDDGIVVSKIPGYLKSKNAPTHHIVILVLKLNNHL